MGAGRGDPRDADASADALAATGISAATPIGDTLPSASAPSSPAPRGDDYGELIGVDARHYVVGREIAHGGMGRIRAARDRRLGREVAIKELLVKDRGLRDRFEREARLTARLTHPAIVAIHEAGTWPSGEPFFSMELVAGRSLDRVIAAATTPTARMALLPNVIAAVDALAFAHSHRIIHRDLKPANILVGEFGETVVIDWGLAKDLGDASAPDLPAGPYRASADAPDATAAGAVMGTPAYMPPEQALGDPVDERADVYALGALLYHVLAGAAPFTGTSAAAVLADVISQRPRSLAARAPGVPPDLIAIVEKAMARAPADRYPSAKQLADDLKRFQTGQLVGAHRYSTWDLVRRWIARHRAIVGASAVATVLLAVGGAIAVRQILHERDVAEHERALAEQHKTLAETRRDAAEKLIQYAIFDLRDRLQPLGKLGYLQGLGEAVVAYYDKVGGDDLDVRRRRGAAITLLGDVRWNRGDLDGALASYRDSLAVYRRELAIDPKSPLYRRDVSVSQLKIANVLLDRGDLDGAIAAEREMIAIREQLVTEQRGRKSIDDLAEGYQALGAVERARGELDAALATFRKELALRTELGAVAPDDGDAQSMLALAHEDLGDVLSNRGDLAAALVEYRAAQALRERVAARDPDNPIWQENLGVARERIGFNLFSQGDVAHALDEYGACRAIRERVVAADPDNARKIRDLAVAYSNEGEAQFRLGHHDLALARLAQAMPLLERLVARDPANASWQRDLSVSLEKIGGVLLDRGDAAGALVQFRRELAIGDALLAKNPDSPPTLRDDAVVHEKVGDTLRKLGKPVDATAEYRTMVARLAKAAAAQPGNDGARADLVAAWTDLGDGLRESNQRAPSSDAYREAAAILDELAPRSSDPLVPLQRAELYAKRALVIDGEPERAALRDRARALVAAAVQAANPDLRASIDEVKALIARK
jgi:tetratricopeptide (TPR) repeat protein